MMRYLTAEELYRLLISSTPPPDLQAEFEGEVRLLRKAGHLSDGAQRLLHLMQTDPGLLNAMAEGTVLTEKTIEFSLEPFEVVPVWLAAMLIASGLPYKPGISTEFRYIPTKEEVARRFEGQKYTPADVRQDIIITALKQVEEDKFIELVQRPRLLVALVPGITFSECLQLYGALCVRLAMMRNPGAEKLTVPIPKEIMKAMSEPDSLKAQKSALEFLLGED